MLLLTSAANWCLLNRFLHHSPSIDITAGSNLLMIYLDNNATTPLKPAVKQAMVDALDVFGNPSSVHAAGREARMLVDTARRHVAALLNVRAEQVVFTSGGTESIVTALRGVMMLAPGQKLMTAATEHAATVVTAQALQVEGLAQTFLLPVDINGVVDIHKLEQLLQQGGVALVSLMHANNETGVLQPIDNIVALCRRYGVLVHVDACQTVGKVPVDFAALGADMLSVSFHKFGGPKGVGALVVKNELVLKTLLTGGGQERNRRSGTENVAAIAGAGVAAKLAPENFNFYHQTLSAYQRLFESKLTHLSNNIVIVGQSAPRLPHTSMVVAAGMPAEMAVMALDLAGVAVSSGSACSSGKVEPSRVLLAQGLSEQQALSGIRFSFGWQTTEAEVHKAVELYTQTYHRITATN